MTRFIRPSDGQKVIKWTLNSAGTPTDLPYPGAMRVFLMYQNTRI